MDGFNFYLSKVMRIKLPDSLAVDALKVILLFEIMLQYAADMIQEV